MNVHLNFYGDFRRIVERVLIENGVDIDPKESYNEAVYRLYSNRRSRAAMQSYQINESFELRCPSDLAASYAELQDELPSSADVNARLSRRLPDATFEDELLNDWGITHFHLGLRKANGTVAGTNIVLFAFVRDSVVHCIGFYEHCSWVKLELLEILQRNWPEAMEHARALWRDGL